MIGPTNRKNWLTFDGECLVIRSRIRIPDHFFISLTNAE